MNIHKNARLTVARRIEMVQDVLERKLPYAGAAVAHGVSVPTVRKWVGRFLSQGECGLRDASSRPQVSPRAIASKTAWAITELRRRYLTHAAIALACGTYSRGPTDRKPMARPSASSSRRCEWAYGIPYRHSLERTAMLSRWIRHYNWHRPHHGIGRVAPVGRLAQSRNNLLALHS